MPHYLSERELRRTAPAELASFKGPIPTQIVSNGEYNPTPQTREQQRVEARVKELAAKLAPRHGMNRRQFLASSAGMAAAFVAMNEVFGPVFDVDHAEAATPGVAEARARSRAGQFIFDVQTHFVRDDFADPGQGLVGFAAFARDTWKAPLPKAIAIPDFKFDNYVKEIFLDSDTTVALLSGTPSDNLEASVLSNEQIAAARAAVNTLASGRMLAHALIAPKKPDWTRDAVDRAIALKPDSWKGYTVGDPFHLTKEGSFWRLDDEKLMYPFYEKIVKAGITTICLHKGLLPDDYKCSWPEVWEYATVKDLPRAAIDWPQIKFVIYHAAMQTYLDAPGVGLARFKQSGRIDWVTDLADIRSKYGVNNVYAEIGTAFATCAVADPNFAAALLGTLVRGLGFDHVLWGTDSVWYGSPQWQIQAFRQIEIPPDMQKAHRFAPLGPAHGTVKTAILGGNAAELYNLDVKAQLGAISTDKISLMKAAYLKMGGLRSNTRYGYVHRDG